MSRKLFLLSLVVALFTFGLNAQTVDELKTQKADKQAQLDALAAEIDDLNTRILEFPGWKFGALGTIGGNYNKYNDWYGAANPYSGGLDLGLAVNAFANLDREKDFWRTGLNFNFQKARTVVDSRNTDVIPDEGFSGVPTIADNIGINSAYGYKLNPKWAVSVLGDYKTTLSNINDPGTLDLGAGLNWTPIPAFTAYFHPLNYNFVFSNNELQNYESSLGCKILAQYNREFSGIAWSSNLSAFVSYADVNNFSNWEWINGFGFNVWKGIGVGVSLGLRGDKQQAYNNYVTNKVDGNGVPSFSTQVDNTDNIPFLDIADLKDADGFESKVQTYLLIGLTYAL